MSNWYRRKSVAILLMICMVFGLFSNEIYAEESANLMITGKLEQLMQDGTKITVANASVQLKNSNSYFGMTTDDQGVFSNSLPAGTYEIISVEHDGEQSRFESLEPIVVDSTHTIFNIVLPANNVSGLVFEETKDHILGSGTIQISRKNSMDNLNSIHFNTEGKFYLALPAGEYHIDYIYLDPVEGKTMGISIPLNQSFTIVDSNQVFNLDVSIPQVNLKGTVSLKDNRTVQNNVSLNLKNLQAIGSEQYSNISIQVNPKGSFEDRLYPGSYELDYISIYNSSLNRNETFYINKKTISITAGMQPIVNNIVVNNIPTLTGTVKQKTLNGSDTVLANAEINVRRQNDTQSPTITAYTDENGKYNAVLPDGTYEITEINLNGTRLNSGTLATITINNGTLVTQDIEIPATNVFGNVFEEGNVNTLGPGYIYVHSTENGSQYNEIKLNSDGTFSGVLSPGNYAVDRVFLSSEAQDVYPLQSFTIVNGNQRTDIELIIPKVNLTGQVTFADKRAIQQDERISLELESRLTDIHRNYRVEVKQDGTYNTRLYAGEYEIVKVNMFNNTTGNEDSIFVDRIPVHITANMSAALVENVTVSNANVSGQVFEESAGNLFGRGSVGIMNTKTYQYYPVSFNDGIFRAALPAGKYQISDVNIWPQDGHYSEYIRTNISFEITDPSQPIHVPVNVPKQNIKGKITFADKRALNAEDYVTLTFWNETLKLESVAQVKQDGTYTGRFYSGDYVLKSIGISNYNAGTSENFFLQSEVIQVTDSMNVKDFTIPVKNIKGMVFEETKERPLGNTYIYFTRRLNGIEFNEYLQAKPDGTFTTAVPAGEYNLYGVNTLENGQYAFVPLSLNWRITNPDEVINADLMIPKVNFTGKVRFNSPMELQSSDNPYLMLLNSNQEIVWVRLNLDGTFIGRLYPGNYVISQIVLNRPGGTYYLTQETITIVPGATTSLNKNISVNNSPTVEGLVSQLQINGSATPVAGAEVEIIGKGELSGMSVIARTSTEGKYLISLPDGSYEIKRITLNGKQLNSGVYGPIIVSYPMLTTFNVELPAISIISGLNPTVVSPLAPVVTKDNTQEVVVKAQLGASINVYNGTRIVGSGTGNGDEAVTIHLSPLSDGVYNLKVKAIDAAGNASGTVNVPAITVDTTKPVKPTVVEPSAAISTNSINPVIKVKAEAGASVKVLSGSTLVGTGTGAGDGAVSITLNTISSGTYSFIVVAADAAGNESDSDTVPAITVISSDFENPSTIDFVANVIGFAYYLKKDAGLTADQKANINNLKTVINSTYKSELLNIFSNEINLSDAQNAKNLMANKSSIINILVDLTASMTSVDDLTNIVQGLGGKLQQLNDLGVDPIDLAKFATAVFNYLSSSNVSKANATQQFNNAIDAVPSGSSLVKYGISATELKNAIAGSMKFLNDSAGPDFVNAMNLLKSKLVSYLCRNKTSTSVALEITPNSSAYLGNVTFSVRVSSTSGGVPTGMVTFLDGDTPMATVEMMYGQAVYSTDTLLAGTHAIKATYQGDSNYDSSLSDVVQHLVLDKNILDFNHDGGIHMDDIVRIMQEGTDAQKDINQDGSMDMDDIRLMLQLISPIVVQ